MRERGQKRERQGKVGGCEGNARPLTSRSSPPVIDRLREAPCPGPGATRCADGALCVRQWLCVLCVEGGRPLHRQQVVRAGRPAEERQTGQTGRPQLEKKRK